MTEVVGTFFSAPKICWRKLVIEVTADMEGVEDDDGDFVGIRATNIEGTLTKWCICQEDKPDPEEDDPEYKFEININARYAGTLEYATTIIHQYCEPCREPPPGCTCEPKGPIVIDIEGDDVGIKFTFDDDGVMENPLRAFGAAWKAAMRSIVAGFDAPVDEDDTDEEKEAKAKFSCRGYLIPDPPPDEGSYTYGGGSLEPNADYFEDSDYYPTRGVAPKGSNENKN
jgi:hypothetical protein